MTIQVYSDAGDNVSGCGRKTRVSKGKSIERHIDDYIILDLETTGVYINTARIVEISAVKVRNNKIVDEYSRLINPGCHIPEEATAVNHITDEMVKNSPFLNDVLDDFLEFVGNDVIVGYNNAGFDMNIVYDAVLALQEKYFSNDYIDVLYAVRRSLPELENAKLETVSKYYDLDTIGEHRALKDCYLTKCCYDKLFLEFGNKAFEKTSNKANYYGTQRSSETKALRELQDFIKYILEDGQISRYEFDVLCYWLEEHRELAGHYPFDKAFCALGDILEDGQVTECELQDLKEILSELIDPVKSQGSHDVIHSLNDKHICLTGDFNHGTKSEVEKLIIDVGGIMDSTVKRSTHYVVVGAKGSEAWKAGNYGSKIQKAMELKEKGLDIKIVEEDVFIPMLINMIV